MKVAFWHFYTFRLLRGIETLVISLANALVRKGVDVSIVTATPTIQPLVRLDPRVRVYAYPTFRYFSHYTIVPFYVSHFCRHQYDYIVVFFADFGEGLTWRLVKRFRPMPLVLYLCYPYSTVPHRYHSFLALGWHRVAKKVLADAKWIAEEAEALFQRPVATVPVGTDPERFRPDPVLRAELRKQYGFDSNDVVLLNVSALERAKGTWRVVEAVGRLRPRFPNLRYFILGRGDDEARLRAMVEGLGLSDIVIFGGTTSRLEAYYNMADIFVMLPDAEANSIACLEAMACGLPVVVANTGGFREVVTEQAGRLVDIHNPEAIDSAIAELARAPELRQAMGLAGRLIIQERLSWGHIAEQLMSIFKQELST